MAFDAGSILAKMRLDISQWEKSARKINDDQKRIAGQTKKTGSAMKGMWKQIAIGVGVTNLVSMGIRGMSRQMSDTIKVGRTFEKEWANVTTMLDISRTATDKMKHELRMLSPTLGDTTELARGMYQVLSASIEPAKAIRFLGEAAKSAKAGVTDTKTAVDALTTVINAYGLEAEDVTGISDIMFATVKKGKLTYGELAQSLGTVIPVAATVGVEFKEIAAATATLTRQGIQASKATMQLRQVMMAVLKPSADAKEIAEELGIELGAAALKARGLSGFLFDLKEKTKGNADLMARLVPNVRALTAVMALAGEQAGAFADDIEFMGDALGLTDEAFRKQFESIDAWIDVAETAADKIKIAFYEGLISSFRESIRTAEDFDEKVTQATNEAANNVSLHVSTMVDMLGGLGRAWKATDEFLFGWIDRLRGAKEEEDDLAKATEKLREAQKRGGREIVITDEKLRKLTKDTIKAEEFTYTYQKRLEILTGITDGFNRMQLTTQIDKMNELAEETDDLAGESALLEGQWEASMSSMEEDTLNFMATIIPGMAFMAESVGDNFEDLGDDIKGTLGDAAMEAGAILSRLGRHSKALAYAGAVINTAQAVTRALSFYPPPISFIMAALQAAAGAAEIAAIKKQDIPTAEKGGWIPSPAIIEAGHGPKGEVILPLDKAPGGIGKLSPTYNFVFNVRALDAVDVDRWFRDVGAKQIEEIFRRNQGGVAEKSEQYLAQYRR